MESGVVCRTERCGIVGGDGPVEFREVDADDSELVVGQRAGVPIAMGEDGVVGGNLWREVMTRTSKERSRDPEDGA